MFNSNHHLRMIPTFFKESSRDSSIVRSLFVATIALMRNLNFSWTSLKKTATNEKRKNLNAIIESRKQQRQKKHQQSTSPDATQIVKLPWVPGVSPKLRKIFRKAGYKTVFKSGSNLTTLLTMKNKTMLPNNSYPGVYKISYTCGQTYIGETKMKVSTRIKQHEKSSFDGNTEYSGVCAHDANCAGEIMWVKAETLKVEPRYYERKIREALEIQTRNTLYDGNNLDSGQYLDHQFWLPTIKYFEKKSWRRWEILIDITIDHLDSANVLRR